MANGCVPAEPMVSPRRSAAVRAWARRARSCSPVCAASDAGFVAISSTDSCSSGLISPSSWSSISDSIALTRSYVSPSTIMSSSSTPSV
jgi:hypothetical protein